MSTERLDAPRPTPVTLLLRVLWIAVKLALVLQFGAPAARVIYEGF